MPETNDPSLEISDDKLEAVVHFSMTETAGTDAQQIQAVEALMRGKGIVAKLDQKALASALSEARDEGETSLRWVAARGRAALPGSDGALIRHFAADAPSDEEAAAADGPDGEGIDFKDVNTMLVAAEGDLLVTAEDGAPGVDGEDVFGATIAALPGETPRLLPGSGTTLDESGRQLFAAVGGLIEDKPANNQVSVSPLYQVNGNVDMDVGHIDFDGSVIVTGNVGKGYRVQATEDVTIHGTVANAEVRAGGNLVIRGGVVGDGRTRIDAAGDADVGFIEDSQLKAGGDIVIQKYCLRAELVAGGKISAVTGAGAVVLGSLSATAGIELNSAGSSGSGTQLNIRPLPQDEEELQALRQRLLSLTHDLASLVRMHGPLLIKRVAEDPRHADSLPQEDRAEVLEIAGRFSEVLAERRKIVSRASQIQQAASAKMASKIIVRKRAHVATVIRFPGGETLKLDRAAGSTEYYIDPNTGNLTAMPTDG